MNELRHCLVVEDSEDDAQLVLRELRRAGYDVTWERVETAATMRAALERQPWDFILCDYNLPQFSGLAALELLRASGLDLPIIIVSGTIGEEQAVAAMQAGASDYVMKDKLGRLGPAVERGLREAAGRREQKRAETALREGEVFNRDVLDSLSAHLAVLDDQGMITAVNEAWRRFAHDNGAKVPGAFVGANYLTVCQAAAGRSLETDAAAALDGIRAVMGGAQRSFSLEYPCDSSTEQRWFCLQVRPLAGARAGVIVAHENITARKQAELALRDLNQELEQRVAQRTQKLTESEANLRAFFDTIDYFCFILDPQGNILRANRTVVTRLGYTEEELTGMPVLQLHPPDRRTEAGSIVMAMLAGTRSCCPVPLQAKDGTLVPVETRVVAGTWQEQPALFGVSKDISELRRSEEKFSAIFQHNPLPMALTSIPDGRFVEVNAAFALVTGYPQAEVIGSTPQELGVFFDPAHGADLLRLMAERESFEHQEWCVRTKAGSLRHGLFSGDLVRLQTESVWLTVMNDITERKTAEVQLRNLWSTVEQSPVVVMITDAAGSIEYVNPRFYQQTGYTPAEAVGRNPRLLKSGRHTAEFYAAMWGALRAGQTWRGEICNRRKDGALFWESTAIAPVRNGTGRISHFVASKEDITERRRIAEELRQAKEAADAANLAKSTFLANMSHEIRTPMNAILGFAQLLLRDSQLSALQQRQLTTIQRSGERLMGLINGILEMARLESSRVDLNPAPFDFHRLLDDLERMFSLRAQAKQLRLVVERAGEVPRYLVADETKLCQVITNLLGNAIKFTPSDGTVSLCVRAETEPDGAGVRLLVQVEDTGPGVAPEDLPRLFKPFFQTERGAAVGGGTGLGLAISRQLARLMGGDCTVQSQVGVGSTFAFDVRVERVAEECAGPETMPGRNVLRLLPDLAACRVLVADDDAANRDLLEEMLRPIGFEIRTAVDGAQAVAQCQAWRPHLVIMDLRMPGMDGFEATRQIRVTHGAAVKIIALSAGVLAEYQAQALAAGVDIFLGKPFGEAELLETIRKLTGVDYVYAHPPEAAAPIADEAQPGGASVESIGRLPVELVAALREATCRGDYAQMLTLVDRIAVQDEHLGRRLRQLVLCFDYDAMHIALGKAESGG